MEMKRKGDVTISTVILIVLGLVVLVMMIVGFTQGFDFLFGLFDRGPSELQTLASACELYASGSLAIDYCNYKVIEIDGVDEIVNCLDKRITDVNTPKGVKLLTCNGLGNLPTVCSQIAPSKLATIKVNNGVGSQCGSTPVA